jgi:hypothetical protein
MHVMLFIIFEQFKKIVFFDSLLGDTITFISDINLRMVYVLQVKSNYCFKFFDVFQKMMET